ncbi:hypothetical protein [Mycoplasma leachii]|uniref:hypothetical protein n=1 Tax=Mycoplasma leachii TaxID=2105 RepID=UPI003DA40845
MWFLLIIVPSSFSSNWDDSFVYPGFKTSSGYLVLWYQQTFSFISLLVSKSINFNWAFLSLPSKNTKEELILNLGCEKWFNDNELFKIICFICSSVRVFEINSSKPLVG